jgi:VanZ family protein
MNEDVRRTISSAVTLVIRVIGWWLVTVIIVLTIVPPFLRPVTGTPHKFEHLVIFLLTGAAFSIGYPRRERMLCIAAILFSAGLEISQHMIPGRHARLSDFLLDALGSCVGIVAASLLRSMRVQLTT